AQAQTEKIFGRVNVVVDAQRGELYLAGYEISAARIAEATPLRLMTSAEAEAMVAGNPVVGPEVMRWFESGREIFPTAAALGKLAAERGDFVSGDRLEPIYLRETNFVKATPARNLERL